MGVEQTITGAAIICRLTIYGWLHCLRDGNWAPMPLANRCTLTRRLGS